MFQKLRVRALTCGAIFLVLFILFTVLTKTVDVAAIGPVGTEVGFSSLNGAVRDALGAPSEAMKKVSDLSGYVLLCFILPCLALVGLVQWIKRKKLFAVDIDILALGAVYLVTGALYLLFKFYAVNFRPVLEAGQSFPEASYPSSHTVLALVVGISAAVEAALRLKDRMMRVLSVAAASVLCAVTLVCRFLSGIHWATDIVAGVVLAAALVLIWVGFLPKKENTLNKGQ